MENEISLGLQTKTIMTNPGQMKNRTATENSSKIQNLYTKVNLKIMNSKISERNTTTKMGTLTQDIFKMGTLTGTVFSTIIQKILNMKVIG